MTRGKKTCKILKEIRQQIADRNDIEYITSECHFQGECKGSCPKCEAELQYLENELSKRRQLGKAVAVAGISLGFSGTFSAYSSYGQNNVPISEQNVITDTVHTFTYPYTTSHQIMGAWPLYDIINKEEIILSFSEIETFPEYPGGEDARINFLRENLVYPQEAKEQRMEGKVLVSFVVEKDGSLTNFEILKSAHPILDEEVLRVVKLMPNWEPGEIEGKTVKVRYQIPVNFALYNNKKIKDFSIFAF
jgi:TonB family protein